MTRGRPPGVKADPGTYKDRFQKFYYAHRERLRAERKATYDARKAAGACVRCGEPANGALFCTRHAKLKRQG